MAVGREGKGKLFDDQIFQELHFYFSKGLYEVKKIVILLNNMNEGLNEFRKEEGMVIEEYNIHIFLKR